MILLVCLLASYVIVAVAFQFSFWIGMLFVVLLAIMTIGFLILFFEDRQNRR